MARVRCTHTHGHISLTHARFLPLTQTSLDELVFDQFGFRSVVVAPAAVCTVLDPNAVADGGSASARRTRAALVLDLGFSSTCVCLRCTLDTYVSDARRGRGAQARGARI